MGRLSTAPRSHPRATMNSNSRMYSNLALVHANLFFYMKVLNRNIKKCALHDKDEREKMTLDGLFVFLYVYPFKESLYNFLCASTCLRSMIVRVLEGSCSTSSSATADALAGLSSSNTISHTFSALS